MKHMDGLRYDGLVHKLRAGGIKIQVSHCREGFKNGGMTIITTTVKNRNFFNCILQEGSYNKKRGVEEALRGIGNGIFNTDNTNIIS